MRPPPLGDPITSGGDGAGGDGGPGRGGAFTPIRTSRLLLRPVHPGDAQALADRRSDPEVARLQSWVAPYRIEDANQLIADSAAAEGPRDGEWWMLTIADADDTTILGDLAFKPTWDGRAVEIGYSLARSAWRQGYAAEAVAGLVARLLESDRLTRVHAMLHPDNVASAQVLERTGFRYEGRTRRSYWVGEDNTDDLLYGMTRDDHEDWLARPRERPDVVQLIEITPHNAGEVLKRTTHTSQERFVAPTVRSFADALVPDLEDGAPVVPWYRAIEADGEIVGFVMMTAITEAHPEPYLWRFLIDRRHQRRGIGGLALDLVIRECRGWGADCLWVSWAEGRGTPAPFYLRRGFVPSGEIIDDEIEAKLDLS